MVDRAHAQSSWSAPTSSGGGWRRRRAPGSSGCRARPAAGRGAGTAARRSGATGRAARRRRSAPCPCIRSTGWDPDSRTTLFAGNRLSAMPHRCSSRQSNIGGPGRCGGTVTLAGGAPFRMTDRPRRRRLRLRCVVGHQRSADDAAADQHALDSKQGGIRRRAKVGKHSFVRRTSRPPRRCRS